jgi:hypothetical protein
MRLYSSTPNEDMQRFFASNRNLTYFHHREFIHFLVFGMTMPSSLVIVGKKEPLAMTFHTSLLQEVI